MARTKGFSDGVLAIAEACCLSGHVMASQLQEVEFTSAHLLLIAPFIDNNIF
jgi:hypothetical protein